MGTIHLEHLNTIEDRRSKYVYKHFPSPDSPPNVFFSSPDKVRHELGARLHVVQLHEGQLGGAEGGAHKLPHPGLVEGGEEEGAAAGVDLGEGALEGIQVGEAGGLELAAGRRKIDLCIQLYLCRVPGCVFWVRVRRRERWIKEGAGRSLQKKSLKKMSSTLSYIPFSIHGTKCQ